MVGVAPTVALGGGGSPGDLESPLQADESPTAGAAVAAEDLSRQGESDSATGREEADTTADLLESAPESQSEHQADAIDPRGSASEHGDSIESANETEAGAPDGLQGSSPWRLEYDDQGFPAVAGEILLLAAEEDVAPLIQDLRLTVIERTPLPAFGQDLFRLRLPPDLPYDKLARALGAQGRSIIFGLNHLYRAGRVGRSAAAGVLEPAPSRGPTVGLIDTAVNARALPHGIRLTQRDFAPRPFDGGEHGTAVASLLARDGAGEILAANVFEHGVTDAAALVRALDWMATNGVSTINMSLAGPPNPVLERVIALMVARGHAIVAAMGNDGPAAPAAYPAAYPGVIAVTAVDDARRVYRYANRGAWVMFAAPGVDLKVPISPGVWHTVSGTSFATPVVAARLARELVRPDVAARDRLVALLCARAIVLPPAGRNPVTGCGLILPAEPRL